MNFILQMFLIIALLGITIQDFLERKVFISFFIISCSIMGIIHFKESTVNLFVSTTVINTAIIIAIVMVLFIYSKFVLKKDFSSTFGLGDFIFFLMLAVGFPTVTFLVIFSFSLFFSATIYFFIKNQLKHKTVPLAGLQAIFVGIIIVINWVFNLKNLYII